MFFLVPSLRVSASSVCVGPFNPSGFQPPDQNSLVQQSRAYLHQGEGSCRYGDQLCFLLVVATIVGHESHYTCDHLQHIIRNFYFEGPPSLPPNPSLQCFAKDSPCTPLPVNTVRQAAVVSQSQPPRDCVTKPCRLLLQQQGRFSWLGADQRFDKAGCERARRCLLTC